MGAVLLYISGCAEYIVPANGAEVDGVSNNHNKVLKGFCWAILGTIRLSISASSGSNKRFTMIKVESYPL